MVPNVFHLTLVRNRGIAFGFFDRHETLLFLLITLSLFIIILLGHKICRDQSVPAPADSSKKEIKSQWLARFGIALIFGGAIGNWIDRIRFNAVIDFLDFRIWPVFNMADSAITVGVGLFLILLLRKS